MDARDAGPARCGDVSPAPSVVEALAAVRRRIGSTATYREIQAGLTTRSYLIEVQGRPHVLRLDTADTARLGLDRARELEIQKQAAAAGLAPRIVAAEPSEGWMVYEYLPGRALAASDLADRATIEAIAAVLREVHALPRSGSTLSVDGAARRYATIVQPEGGLHSFAARCVEIVAAIPAAVDLRCCHNDVVAANIISNGVLRLIDWEYACDNDPMFDLASLCCYHDVGERAAATLLGAYAGGQADALRERFETQRRLFDALQWLWLAAQHVLAPSDGQLRRLASLRNRIE